MKRTNEQIIAKVKNEISGMMEFTKDAQVISSALNKRYNPNKIAIALEQLATENKL